MAPNCAPAPQEQLNDVPHAQLRFEPARLTPLATGRNVTVAVIDSGVAASHPRLADRVLGGRDFLRSNPTAHEDCNGHGTGVASIIVAGTPKDGSPLGVDLKGLAPDATILPARVSEQQDLNEDAGTAVDERTFAESIRWAADNAQVINLSLALYRDDPGVAAAIRYALSRDVVVVAAAGNLGDAEGRNPTPYPAAYDGVLGVGAISANGLRSNFSQYGPYVDVVAPGEGITVAAVDGGYRRVNGTSFATPFVSATVALIRQRFPSMKAPEVVRRVRATADPTPGGRDSETYGQGVVNPYRALTESLAAPPPPNPVAALPSAGDPVEAAVQRRRADSRSMAFTVAGIGVGAAVLAALAALVLPRGIRRRWRPADPV